MNDDGYYEKILNFIFVVVFPYKMWNIHESSFFLLCMHYMDAKDLISADIAWKIIFFFKYFYLVEILVSFIYVFMVIRCCSSYGNVYVASAWILVLDSFCRFLPFCLDEDDKKCFYKIQILYIKHN